MKPWHLILVFCVAVALYANTAGHGYVLDDRAIITENEFTQQGFSGIDDHLVHSYWYGLNQRDEGNYRPISGVSFAIEHGLFGNSPGVGHILNILFYGLLCVVLLRWLNALELLGPKLNLLVVLLFATHPIHTEVVANIKSRDEIYCLLFFTWSALTFWRWLEHQKASTLIISMILFLLSVLSKETSLGLLPLFPLMALKHGAGLTESLKKAVAPLVIAGIYLTLYFSITEVLSAKEYHLFDNALIQDAPAGEIWATKFWIIAEYARLLIIPFPLVHDYSYNSIPLVSFGNVQAILGVTIVVGTLGWLIWNRIRYLKKPSVGTFGMVLVILPLIPVSNFFFPIGATLAERFLFIPSLGFALLLAALAGRLLPRLNQPVLKLSTIFFAITSLVFGFLTIDRNWAWESNETLYSADIEHRPNSARAHQHLATVYHILGDEAKNQAMRQRQYSKAVPLLERAIEIYPDPDLYTQLATIQSAQSNWKEVKRLDAIRLELDSTDQFVWLELGVACAMTRDIDGALRAFERAYALDPDDLTAGNNLAKTYAALKRYDEAIAVFNEVLDKDAGNKEATQGLRETLLIMSTDTMNIDTASTVQPD